MKKILVICETTDFQNFTRRATIEAIHEIYPCLEIMLCGGWKSYLKGTKSKSMTILSKYYLYLLPKKLRNNIVIRNISQFIDKLLLGKYFGQFDIVFFLKPSDEFFLTHFKKQKKIFLISDPYHLLSGNNFDELKKERTLFSEADIAFATSLALQTDYIEKYYKPKKIQPIYWPNTVDLNEWNNEKSQETPSVAGYAGNLSEVTVDLDLLEEIANTGIKVEIAGKINCKTENFRLQFKNILKNNSNINYLGWQTKSNLKKRMINWKVGLLLDPINDISKYIHHNKPYQYFAMGFPVISKDYLPDYKTIPHGMFLEKSNTSYTKKLIEIMKSTYDITNLKEIAKENSSIVRAKQFIQALKKERVI